MTSLSLSVSYALCCVGLSLSLSLSLSVCVCVCDRHSRDVSTTELTEFINKLFDSVTHSRNVDNTACSALCDSAATASDLFTTRHSSSSSSYTPLVQDRCGAPDLHGVFVKRCRCLSAGPAVLTEAIWPAFPASHSLIYSPRSTNSCNCINSHRYTVWATWLHHKSYETRYSASYTQ